MGARLLKKEEEMEEIRDLIAEAVDLDERIGGRITGNQKAWMAKVEEILVLVVDTFDSIAEEMSTSGVPTVREEFFADEYPKDEDPDVRDIPDAPLDVADVEEAELGNHTEYDPKRGF